MRRTLATGLAALVTATALAVTAAAPASAGPGRDRPVRTPSAAQVVAGMQPGWNLGNTLDAVGADETAWGNPRATRELFDAVEDAGFRSVRVPVTFGQRTGPAPDHTVDPALMDRVEEVVDLALDEDLVVLLDVHHDSWMWAHEMPTRHDEVVAQFRATWEQIAERFRDHPRTLLLESLNEPQFAGVDDAAGDVLLDELNRVFHEVVRGSGGGNADRVLVLPTLHTNAGQERLDALAGTIDALDDANLAATVHYYGYWPFSVNVAGGTRFDATALADMTGTFDRVRETFVDQGVPVVLGEYGLLGFDRHTGTIEQGEKLKFFEELGHQARAAGVTTMLWDNGQHLGRTSFAWSDPALFAQISSSWSGRSGVASTDQVFVEPGAATDQTITLQPNGRTFRDLRLDGRQLKKGRDYAINGTALTLHASLLDRLVGDGPTGTRAELFVRYGGGLPWRVEVVAATAPVLQAATGTTADFAVPTAFHGDRLATMEARYADGTNAGPHGWTSFKEYDVTFAPDEEAGRIVLRPAFFAEVTDGAQVTLTFHFWSGRTVTYEVTRTGTEVTGTP
ncbi:cellulase family glycosylhydrolase [Cellulomonas oligotrophica]|uniref:Aryl-phospho-beta-D-glucosidase BglC (GH1 family) n=1 Tax=Cellulomonas oligotrophica TaxID=931536 RepID=A0A7Y9JZJ8_9CELL|nr:cellulase family glycosylhydrolase [Cellulomonas oligotrophica]NYD86270.1 aryl-phospho-beta-D-glucosidase BglC (GH1 family) [Cellulomonas oligotrophica]GIG34404.1 endoglucanase [Cellulomonas oligotrophica]